MFVYRIYLQLLLAIAFSSKYPGYWQFHEAFDHTPNHTAINEKSQSISTVSITWVCATLRTWWSPSTFKEISLPSRARKLLQVILFSGNLRFLPKASTLSHEGLNLAPDCAGHWRQETRNLIIVSLLKSQFILTCKCTGVAIDAGFLHEITGFIDMHKSESTTPPNLASELHLASGSHSEPYQISWLGLGIVGSWFESSSSHCSIGCRGLARAKGAWRPRAKASTVYRQALTFVRLMRQETLPVVWTHRSSSKSFMKDTIQTCAVFVGKLKAKMNIWTRIVGEVLKFIWWKPDKLRRWHTLIWRRRLTVERRAPGSLHPSSTAKQATSIVGASENFTVAVGRLLLPEAEKTAL